jgi:putative endonuclease
MDTDRRLGRWGEKVASRFLKSQGYRILHRNYVTSVGEIDLVAREGDVLVFVEVKTRTSDDFGGPLLAVDRAKQRKLGLLARSFLARKRLGEVPCRFDVVGVLFHEDRKDPEIELVRDAFPLRRR